MKKGRGIFLLRFLPLLIYRANIRKSLLEYEETEEEETYPTMADTELQSIVHKHRLFFDSLVELIPAKFYIAKEEHESTWHYGMSKFERAAAKQVTKQNLKKAKRNRLDPDKLSSTLQQLQQQETEKPSDGTEKKVEDVFPSDKLKGKESRVSSYEELKERLRKRMEMLRAKRNADAAVIAAKNAQTWKNEKKSSFQNQNRKRKATFSEPDMEENGGAKHSKQATQSSENGPINKVKAKESSDNFEFGRVKMGLQNDAKRTKKKHKDSKESLLAKAAKLQSAMQDPEKGPEVALKHSWSAAFSRASGEKVLDDPDRIKQSIKREKHQRLKSIKKWEDRKETVKHSVEERQQTRDGHIKERKQQKKERKIAKREKKLLRPGFEGRRGGFLNE